MSWLEFDESLQLKSGSGMVINQRIDPAIRPSGEVANVVLKTGDDVIFQRSLSIDKNTEVHYFIAILKEDLLSIKEGRDSYGEILLTNQQVRV